ncbi:FAD-binding domain-containing protein [Coxiella-like endosymbiont]|nr:FAD-binding domain-containing protein [Coxiella-like endosymbiont]
MKKWLPELVNVLTKYIHYPANMYLNIIQSFKIHFGVDYPHS